MNLTNRKAMVWARVGGAILLLLCACFHPNVWAQDSTVNSSEITSKWPFIRLDSNRIQHAEYLASFWQKLNALSQDSISQLRILHIGDSHIQADLFSGVLRKHLQQEFGAAGRGMVFPYRTGGTNGPQDYVFSSNVAWSLLRKTHAGEGASIGISGYGLKCSSNNATLFFQTKPKLRNPDTAFDRIHIFSANKEAKWALGTPGKLAVAPAPASTTPAPAPQYHKVKSGDTLYDLAKKYRCSVKDLQRWNGLRTTRLQIGQRLMVNPGGGKTSVAAQSIPSIEPLNAVENQSALHHRSLSVDTALQEMILQYQGSEPLLLHGIMLENTKSRGIIYNMSGVNGATYRHFNESAWFASQVKAMQPHLIIISLGTNEAMGARFEEEPIRYEVNRLLKTLRQNAPECDILLSTNPDILRAKTHLHPNNLKVRAILKEAATQHRVAVWDLHQVMGGHGSVIKWRNAGLAARDAVHFSASGYSVQGKLLFMALMEALERHSSTQENELD